MAITLTPKEKLLAGRYVARAKAPYLTTALHALVPRETTEIPTMATSATWVLYWNPAFVATLSVEKVAAVLAHEVSHGLNQHHARNPNGTDIHQRDAKIRTLDRLWNIAGDAAINPGLSAGGWRLPEGHITPTTLGLPEALTAEEYYDRLRQRQAKQEEKGKGEDGGDEGDEGEPCAGCCGGLAGHPATGEPNDPTDGHSDTELARVRTATAAAIRAHMEAKGRGSVPAFLARWAELDAGTPQIPWSRVLARLARQAVAHRAGAADYHWARPSRRQAALGWRDQPILPAMHRPIPRIAFVADTSGSMGTAEGQLVLDEAAGVLRGVAAEVVFGACDAAQHSLRVVRTIREVKPLLQGGGGTSFYPIFAAVRRLNPRCSVLIIATDGDGACPPAPPAGLSVIWLLTGNHAHAPAPWGTAIRVA